ncbi:right-handed parallel beta-helix repeat-containing protein [Candidatus Woesearchaeota archaeon]|nr:right-handed parallel beta-helix repeat-containing protein [Candidatus Woesearchaeota archaeon]
MKRRWLWLVFLVIALSLSPLVSSLLVDEYREVVQRYKDFFTGQVISPLPSGDAVVSNLSERSGRRSSEQTVVIRRPSPPVAEACTPTALSFDRGTASFGQSVTLRIAGNGLCEGVTFTVKIFEDLSPDGEGVTAEGSDPVVDEVKVTFTKSPLGEASWIVPKKQEPFLVRALHLVLGTDSVFGKLVDDKKEGKYYYFTLREGALQSNYLFVSDQEDVVRRTIPPVIEDQIRRGDRGGGILAGVAIGEGCTDAYSIDKDCDGYGVRKRMDNQYILYQGDDYGDLPDADDRDPQVHDTASVYTKYNTRPTRLENLKDFLEQGRGYNRPNRIFFIQSGASNANGIPNDESRPFGDLEYIRNTYAPGPNDFILYRGGRYTNWWPNRFTNLHGQIGQPIVIMAYPGERVVFDAVYPLGIDFSDYLIVDGIIAAADTCCGGGLGDWGITFGDQAKHIILRNMEESRHNRGVFSRVDFYIEDVTLEDSIIHDNSVEHGLYFASLTVIQREIKLKNSLIYRNRRHGIQFNGRFDSPLLEGNIIHSNADGGFTFTNGVQGAVVRNNLIFNNAKQGMILYAYCDGGYFDCTSSNPAVNGANYRRSNDNNLFLNNIIWVGRDPNCVREQDYYGTCSGGTGTLYSPSSFATILMNDDKYSRSNLEQFTFTNNQFRNNIFVSYGVPIILSTQFRHIPPTLFTYNLIYRADQQRITCTVAGSNCHLNALSSWGADTPPTYSHTGYSCPTGAPGNPLCNAWTLADFQRIPNKQNNQAASSLSSLFTNVQFTYAPTPDRFNFLYLPTSPAIDFGDPADIPGQNNVPLNDLRNLPRTRPIDAGAYEAQGGKLQKPNVLLIGDSHFGQDAFASPVCKRYQGATCIEYWNMYQETKAILDLLETTVTLDQNHPVLHVGDIAYDQGACAMYQTARNLFVGDAQTPGYEFRNIFKFHFLLGNHDDAGYWCSKDSGGNYCPTSQIVCGFLRCYNNNPSYCPRSDETPRERLTVDGVEYLLFSTGNMVWGQTGSIDTVTVDWIIQQLDALLTLPGSDGKQVGLGSHHFLFCGKQNEPGAGSNECVTVGDIDRLRQEVGKRLWNPTTQKGLRIFNFKGHLHAPYQYDTVDFGFGPSQLRLPVVSIPSTGYYAQQSLNPAWGSLNGGIGAVGASLLYVRNSNTIDVDIYNLNDVTPRSLSKFTTYSLQWPTAGQFDFDLVFPLQIVLERGRQVPLDVNINHLSGTAQPVSLALGTLPSGVTADPFTPPSCTPNCLSRTTLYATLTSPLGQSPVAVRGTSGSLVKSPTFTLDVQQPFDFSLQANPSSGSVPPIGQVSTTLDVTMVNNGATPRTVDSFQAQNLPSGVTATFNPTSCVPTSTTPCRITAIFTANGASPGAYNLNLIARGGLSYSAIQRNTPYTLTVQQSQPPPSITALVPDTIRNNILRTVDIQGSNFDSQYGIWVRGQGEPTFRLYCTYLSSFCRWRSSSLIEMDIPAGAPSGIFEFKVQNSDLQESNTRTLTVQAATCLDGQRQFCPEQRGVCAGSQETCTNGDWPGCTSTTYRNHNANYRTTEVGMCQDTFDNDCDGELDYDGSGSIRGDNDCPIGVTAITAPSAICPATSFTLDCTATVGNVRSVQGYLDAQLCTFTNWNGNIASFSCTSQGSPGQQTARCTINQQYSYQSGGDQIQPITVGGANCCSQYGTQPLCQADSRCSWCLNCQGQQWSGGQTRCVQAGTCTYACSMNQCGATCDGTIGGCSQTQTCNLNTCSCLEQSPSISSISSSMITLGTTTSLTLTGQYFAANAEVRVDGTPLQAGRILTQSATSIVFQYQPRDFGVGQHQVTVYNPTSQRTSNPISLTVTATPQITRLNPAVILNNQINNVDIEGQEFDPVAVFVDGRIYQGSWISPTHQLVRLTDIQPNIQPGDYPVQVVNRDAQRSNSMILRVNQPFTFALTLQPSLATVTPNSRLPVTLTITGVLFSTPERVTASATTPALITASFPQGTSCTPTGTPVPTCQIAMDVQIGAVSVPQRYTVDIQASSPSVTKNDQLVLNAVLGQVSDCTNTRRDPHETDVDCGGPICAPAGYLCDYTKTCLLHRDCKLNPGCTRNAQPTGLCWIRDLTCQPDDDCDDVPNSIDRCPRTPTNTLVSPRNGCPFPKYTKFTPTLTTDFTQLDDFERIRDISLGIAGLGRIQYSGQEVSVLRLVNQIYQALDLDAAIMMQANRIGLSSIQYPELNKPATLTFYGLPYTTTPTPLKDGQICPANICKSSSYSTGTYVMMVTSFSDYGTQVGSCGDSYCNLDESCSTCSQDCGSCGGTGGGGGGGGSGGGGGGGGSSQRIVVDLDANIQQTVSFFKGSRIIVKYQYQEYGVRVPKATQDEVILVVPGTSYSVLVGQKSGIDITQDDRNDATVEYVGLRGNLVTLTFSRIIRDRIPTYKELQQPSQGPLTPSYEQPALTPPSVQRGRSLLSIVWVRIPLIFFILVLAFYFRYVRLRRI